MSKLITFIPDLQPIVQIRCADLRGLRAHGHNRRQALFRKKISPRGSQNHRERYDDRKRPHDSFERFLLPVKRLQNHQREFPAAYRKRANHPAKSVSSSGHISKGARSVPAGACQPSKRFRAEHLRRKFPSSASVIRQVLGSNHDPPVRVEDHERVVSKPVLRDSFEACTNPSTLVSLSSSASTVVRNASANSDRLLSVVRRAFRASNKYIVPASASSTNTSTAEYHSVKRTRTESNMILA
jgi:hypothetical protein